MSQTSQSPRGASWLGLAHNFQSHSNAVSSSTDIPLSVVILCASSSDESKLAKDDFSDIGTVCVYVLCQIAGKLDVILEAQVAAEQRQRGHPIVQLDPRGEACPAG
jgi:hypothetical protein